VVRKFPPQKHAVSLGPAVLSVDIYKQAASSRYGSVDDTTTASSLSYLALRVYLLLQVQSVRMEEETAPTFTGRYRGHELHTHAPINHLVYHFGPGELRGEN
jgi:hypothetical protein